MPTTREGQLGHDLREGHIFMNREMAICPRPERWPYWPQTPSHKFVGCLPAASGALGPRPAPAGALGPQPAGRGHMGPHGDPHGSPMGPPWGPLWWPLLSLRGPIGPYGVCPLQSEYFVLLRSLQELGVWGVKPPRVRMRDIFASAIFALTIFNDCPTLQRQLSLIHI